MISDDSNPSIDTLIITRETYDGRKRAKITINPYNFAAPSIIYSIIN